MSNDDDKKTKSSNSSGIILPSSVIAEVAKAQQEARDAILAHKDEIESMGLALREAINSPAIINLRYSLLDKQDEIRLLSLATQRIIDESFLPIKRINELFANIHFQTSIYTEEILKFQNVAQTLIANSGIFQLANQLQSIQVKAFVGLVVQSDFQKTLETYQNGITRVSTPHKTRLLTGGQVKFEMETKTQSALSGEIVYERIETIDNRLQLLDDKLETNNKLLSKLERKIKQKDSLIEVLLDNPFPYFRINSFEFIKEISTFIINKMIKVEITSKTNQDDLCQVLFSGKKKTLTDEWYIEDVLKELELLIGVEAKKFNWSKVKNLAFQINQKIAMESTIKDAIRYPRDEIIQLNPLYFSPKK